MYIFRWVVSSDLDLRALEQLSLVCRGFYICARSAPPPGQLGCVRARHRCTRTLDDLGFFFFQGPGDLAFGLCTGVGKKLH